MRLTKARVAESRSTLREAREGIASAPAPQKSRRERRADGDPEEERRKHDGDAVDRRPIDHRERARPGDFVDHGARAGEPYRREKGERNRRLIRDVLELDRSEPEPPLREEKTETDDEVERSADRERRAQPDGGKEPEHREQRPQHRSRGVGRVETPDPDRRRLVRAVERAYQDGQRRSHGDGRGKKGEKRE